MSNAEKYLQEIGKLRKEIPRYALGSVAFGLIVLLGGRAVLESPLMESFSPESVEFRVIEVALSFGLPFMVWHELYLKAEGGISRLKQKIRDYKKHTNLPNPVQYSRLEKFVNATMILHDNSQLPD